MGSTSRPPRGSTDPGRSSSAPPAGSTSRSAADPRLSPPAIGDRPHGPAIDRSHRRIDREILDLELDLAAIVPLIDRRMEDDRAGGAGGEGLAFLGEVPADRFHHDVALAE